MKTEYIHPFLESTQMVMTQFLQITTEHGDLEIKDLTLLDQFVWIKIGLKGEWKGDIFFSIHEEVALKLVSAMMGGFEINQLDELSKSAISELGNMITGNASTILSNQGVSIDITPPQILLESEQVTSKGQAVSVPLKLGDLGSMELQMIVLEK